MSDNLKNTFSNHKYDSYELMIKELRKTILAKKLSDVDTISISKNQIIVNAKIHELVSAIRTTCDVAVQRSTSSSSLASIDDILYIYNPKSKLMTSNVAFFEQIFTDLSSDVDLSGEEHRSIITIDDISNTTTKVMKKLLRSSHTRDLNPLTNQYLVTLNNKIIDLKSKHVDDLEEIEKSFDIISKNSINYVDETSLTKIVLDKVMMYKHIIMRVMKDWSDNRQDVEHLMWEIIYAVMQNDNHNKFIVIKGPGGNGKSTFMNLLGKIAGDINTHHANIHQFGDPNAINSINMSTRVILGDDAATNHKLSDVALSNLKSIVTGDPISLPMKYSQNVVVRTNGLFVQGTNTDIGLYENNPAVKSRMILLNWTNTDFRSKSKTELDFDLDELMKEQLFIDVWAHMCLEKIEDFKEFTIPQSVVEATDDMIESNDTIKQFLDEVYPMIDGFKKIPIKILYVAYQNWIKENNPRSGVMKLITFTKQILTYENKFDFKISQMSERKRFSNDSSMSSLSKILDIDVTQLKLDAKHSYLSPQHPISQKELDDFNIDNLDFDHLSNRDYQILIKLAYEHHQTYVMTIINTLI